MASGRIQILSGVGFAVGLLAATYRPFWRDVCVNWGATPDEVTLNLGGDELLPDADVVTTRAIAIEAPPDRVWPWLVQMGSGRAGTYTYDWMENLFGLDMHSAEVVLPQFQALKAGDEFPIGTRTMRVEALDPDRLLVTRVPEWNWVRIFCLAREEKSTRLVVRNRIAYPGMNAVSQIFQRLVSEPGGLLMERKMLRGIKQRAENEDATTWPDRWHGGQPAYPG